MNSRDDANSTIDVPAAVDEVGYRTDELLSCPRCGRMNPPNRLGCLYCAAVFDKAAVDLSEVRLKAGRLEIWEQGFNVVAVSFPEKLDDKLAARVATNIRTDVETIRAAARQTLSLPLLRAASEDEAAIARANLARLAVSTVIVPDAALDAGNPPVRCRAIFFGKESLTLVPRSAGAEIEISPGDVTVIVAGTLRESRIESTEKRKIRSSEINGEVESSTELPLVDFYTGRHAAGFRISAGGFDFSCLGAEKSFVAAKNFALLLDRLVRFCPGAKFVSHYDGVRPLLDRVWERDERSDSLGAKRTGLGSAAVASVATSSNLTQFIKFSRLQRYLLAR